MREGCVFWCGVACRGARCVVLSFLFLSLVSARVVMLSCVCVCVFVAWLFDFESASWIVLLFRLFSSGGL